MPKARRKTKAIATAEALTVLTRLAHQGAYATVAAPAARCAIYSPRNAFADPVAHATPPAIAHGVRKGWLAADAGGTNFRISAEGLRALRAAKSGPAGSGTKVPPQRGADTVNRTAAEGALAWLRRRKDKDGRALITEVQFNAGEKLAADFWHAQLSPKVTAS